MESKVTALERAFQLAQSGRKQEGYDERVVTEGGRSLTLQLRELIRTSGLAPKPAEKL
jgi:hypothetical protein